MAPTRQRPGAPPGPGRAAIRRRRVLLAALTALCLAAFAVGASIGTGTDVRKKASPASHLSLDRLAGQRIVLSFDGTRIPGPVTRAIRSGRIAGVILFADNFPSRSEGRRLIRRLQSIGRPKRLRSPLLIMTDQEGGLVKRVSGAPSASAEAMGRKGPSFTHRQGRRTARNLENVGVNVDLAPVLDVGRKGSDMVKTHRTFGMSARSVSRNAIPFAKGLLSGGVASTAKHFPGLGSARFNTDDVVQHIKIGKRTLRRVDEAPYRAYIRAGAPLVMINSAIYPAFGRRPAAFERSVVTGELRRRLGFRGVTISDALSSVAVRAFGGPAKAAVAGTRAGTDLLLYTDYGPALRGQRALVRKLRAKKLKRGEFVAAADRILALRAKYGR